MPEIYVIAQKSHPIGGFYLARLSDGTFRAGRTDDSARCYPSFQNLYDTMRSLARNGSHWAWNICYELESLA